MWQQGKRARGEIASSDHFILVSLPLFSMSCPTPATSRFPCCAFSQVPILRPSCLIHVCWLTSPSNSKLGTTTTNACDSIILCRIQGTLWVKYGLLKGFIAFAENLFNCFRDIFGRGEYNAKLIEFLPTGVVTKWISSHYGIYQFPFLTSNGA